MTKWPSSNTVQDTRASRSKTCSLTSTVQISKRISQNVRRTESKSSGPRSKLNFSIQSKINPSQLKIDEVNATLNRENTNNNNNSNNNNNNNSRKISLRNSKIGNTESSTKNYMHNKNKKNPMQKLNSPVDKEKLIPLERTNSISSELQKGTETITK